MRYRSCSCPPAATMRWHRRWRTPFGCILPRRPVVHQHPAAGFVLVAWIRSRLRWGRRGTKRTCDRSKHHICLAAVAARSAPAAEAPPFFTNLNMSPIFDTQGSDPSRVCALRHSYADARWLALCPDDSGERLSAALGICSRNRYANDADSVARLPSLGSQSAWETRAPV